LKKIIFILFLILFCSSVFAAGKFEVLRYQLNVNGVPCVDTIGNPDSEAVMLTNPACHESFDVADDVELTAILVFKANEYMYSLDPDFLINFQGGSTDASCGYFEGINARPGTVSVDTSSGAYTKKDTFYYGDYFNSPVLYTEGEWETLSDAVYSMKLSLKTNKYVPVCLGTKKLVFVFYEQGGGSLYSESVLDSITGPASPVVRNDTAYTPFTDFPKIYPSGSDLVIEYGETEFLTPALGAWSSPPSGISFYSAPTAVGSLPCRTFDGRTVIQKSSVGAVIYPGKKYNSVTTFSPQFFAGYSTTIANSGMGYNYAHSASETLNSGLEYFYGGFKGLDTVTRSISGWQINYTPSNPEICVNNALFTAPVQGVSGDGDLEYSLWEMTDNGNLWSGGSITFKLVHMTDSGTPGNYSDDTESGSFNYTWAITRAEMQAMSPAISGSEAGINLNKYELLTLEDIPVSSIPNEGYLAIYAYDSISGKMLDTRLTDLHRYGYIQPENRIDWPEDEYYTLPESSIKITLRNLDIVPDTFKLILAVGDPNNVGFEIDSDCSTGTPTPPFSSGSNPAEVEGIYLESFVTSGTSPSRTGCVSFTKSGIYTIIIENSVGTQVGKLSFLVGNDDIFISKVETLRNGASFDTFNKNDTVDIDASVFNVSAEDKTTTFTVNIVDAVTNTKPASVLSNPIIFYNGIVPANDVINPAIYSINGLEAGNYKITATATNDPVEIAVENNTQVAWFTVEDRQTVQGPDLHPLFILLIVVSVIVLIRKQ